MAVAQWGGRDGEGTGLGQDGGGDGKREEKETRLSRDVEMDEDVLEVELELPGERRLFTLLWRGASGGSPPQPPRK